MKVGRIKAVTLISQIQQGLDYMSIVIGEGEYRVFGDYYEHVSYINEDVVYEVRPDIYNGEVISVVTGLSIKRVIQTVPETSGIKLISAGNQDNDICNLSLDSIRPGSTEYNVICYVSDFKVDSSTKAVWLDFNVIDMKSVTHSVRLFSSKGESVDELEMRAKSFIGCYVKFDQITKTQYGLQTTGFELYPVEVVMPAEVEIAINIIKDAVKDDEALCSYMSQFDVIEQLKGIVDSVPGFHLVRIATEIVMIKSLSNISNMYSETELIRAAVTSRGYLIDRKNNFSKVVLNVNKITRSGLKTDMQLIDILDVMSENTSPLKRVYIEVAKFCNFIVEERRGLIDEESVIGRIMSISNEYGGLL